MRGIKFWATIGGALTASLALIAVGLLFKEIGSALEKQAQQLVP